MKGRIGMDYKKLLKIVYMTGTVPTTEYQLWPEDERIVFRTKRSGRERACVSSRGGGVADEIAEGEAVMIPSFSSKLLDEAITSTAGAQGMPCHLHIVRRGSEVAVMTYPTECEPGGYQEKKQEVVPAETGLIAFDQLEKVKMVTAEILSAEPVAKADKLMAIQVKVGDATRQIVAGIRQHYASEALVGKTIIIVSNLEPRKLKGMESNGMLLAVRTPEGGLRLLTTDGPACSGLEVG